MSTRPVAAIVIKVSSPTLAVCLYRSGPVLSDQAEADFGNKLSGCESRFQRARSSALKSSSEKWRRIAASKKSNCGKRTFAANLHSTLVWPLERPVASAVAASAAAPLPARLSRKQLTELFGARARCFLPLAPVSLILSLSSFDVATRRSYYYSAATTSPGGKKSYFQIGRHLPTAASAADPNQTKVNRLASRQRKQADFDEWLPVGGCESLWRANAAD